MSLGSYIRVLQYARDGARNINSTVYECIQENEEVLLELNRSQILQGRDSDGELFSPTYEQDPYFTSPEKGANYGRWKERIRPEADSLIYTPLFSAKPAGVPNLFVTGPFVSGMFITTGTTSFVIDSSYFKSGDINSKYKGKVFGLTQAAIDFFYRNFLRRRILQAVYINYR